MTITLHCPRCKTGAKIGTKECKKCSHRFTPTNRKYRVTVKLSNGRRKSKIAGSLDLAKKLESKFKTESLENQFFDIQKAPLLYDAWDQYLAWAKINKKSWKDDEDRWRVHVLPALDNVLMDKVAPLDIERVLNRMLSADNRRVRPYLSRLSSMYIIY